MMRDTSAPAGEKYNAALVSVRRVHEGLMVVRVQPDDGPLSFNPGQYDLSTKQPLKIGFGQHDYFNGKMRDVRLYNRALSPIEVARVKGAKQ